MQDKMERLHLEDYVDLFECILIGENLKGLAQAKIIKKSVILYWLLNMTIGCKHVHRQELQTFFNFCAIETKILISNY